MSDQDCRNDCTLPLRFPRRPGTEPPAAHGKDCPCCGDSPVGISQDNRPALSRFNYRIGTYGSIREFLFHQIDKTPELQNWTHREPDDPGVALLEGASILGDILAFYQETYANEAYLRTAQWRESIADLVRLLGYRLSPAVGGNAVFAFELKKDEPVTIPAGFPLKATLEELPKPAEFETAEEITAYPCLNRFNLYKPLTDGDITPATTEFYISAPEQLLYPIEFKPGERLMIGESAASWPAQPLHLAKAEIVIVDSVRELHGTKIVKLKGNMKRISPISHLTAYRIGRTFHHFGYNGPEQIVDTSEPVESSATVTVDSGSGTSETETSSAIPYLDVPSSRPVKTPSGAFSDPSISRSIKTTEFPLDTELDDLPAKVPIVIQARFAHPFLGEAAEMFDPLPEISNLVRSIEAVSTTTLSWGGIDGTVSQIRISNEIYDSIGDGDPATGNAARMASDEANAEADDAAVALADAEADAKIAKANAASAAEAAVKAEKEAAEKSAKADAAAGKAATMAVAAEVAAITLKDDATDAATQAALDAANVALSAVDDAKSKSATAADAADDAAGKAADAKTAADTLATVTAAAAVASLGLNFPLNAAAAGATAAAVVVSSAKGDADTAKTKAETAEDAAITALEEVESAKDAAEIAREAARDDAAAKQRSIDADDASTTAKTDADTAVIEADNAKTAVINAASAAASAAMTAADAADLVKTAAANLAAAKIKAASKKIVRDTRMYIRDALFHEVTSPLFTLKRVKKETTAITGNTLNFNGTAEQVQTLKDRRIMLEHPDAEPAVLNVTNVPATFDSTTEIYPQLHAITLSEQVAYSNFPNENPTVTVFGNLADADEGKTLPETPIGSGDANHSFQNFKLPKAPLTYHIIPENTPSETPQLEIYVDGRQWAQVDSFFGRGKDEQVYIVREDADDNSWVQFGDGKTGARLTSGVNNVTAVYRIGDGAYGPLKDDTKVQASAKIKNLDKIGMPSDATGGAAPEDGENARNAAPGKVQSLGRIVSLKDFEAEAAAIPGVAAASAAWQLVDNIPAVVATVLMETGRSTEIAAVRDTLNSYNTQRGAGRHAIDVVPGRRMYVTATVQYALKPTYRADLIEPVIRRALGVNYARATRDEDQTGLFSLRKRRFGGREYASSIAGTVQNVEGVRWARTVAFDSLSDSDDPETITLPTTTVLNPIVSCDSGHVLSLYDKHLLLSAVKEEGS